MCFAFHYNLLWPKYHQTPFDHPTRDSTHSKQSIFWIRAADRLFHSPFALSNPDSMIFIAVPGSQSRELNVNLKSRNAVGGCQTRDRSRWIKSLSADSSKDSRRITFCSKFRPPSASSVNLSSEGCWFVEAEKTAIHDNLRERIKTLSCTTSFSTPLFEV